MAKQSTFGDLEMAGQRRTTKRDEFLSKMDGLVPFAEWCALIAPHYYAGRGPGRPPGGDEREIERRKASVRSKVEHPFQVIKQRFGWTKTRYRGIAKNLHKARVMACLSNLAMLASAGRSLDPPAAAAPA